MHAQHTRCIEITWMYTHIERGRRASQRRHRAQCEHHIVVCLFILLFFFLWWWSLLNMHVSTLLLPSLLTLNLCNCCCYKDIFVITSYYSIECVYLPSVWSGIGLLPCKWTLHTANKNVVALSHSLIRSRTRSFSLANNCPLCFQCFLWSMKFLARTHTHTFFRSPIMLWV